MRQALLKERRALTNNLIQDKSNVIFDKLIALPQYIEAQVIMCYAAMNDEVQTYEIIKHAMAMKKKVCIPYIGDQKGIMNAVLVEKIQDLVRGKFGILTVGGDDRRIVEPAQIDAIILPGVAFGRRGERLGMGAGFYDRFLPKTRKAALLGIAFSCQVSEKIPIMPYDYFVDYVITEDEIINCKTGKM